MLSENVYYLTKVDNGEKNYENLNNHSILCQSYFNDDVDDIESFLEIILEKKYDKKVNFLKNDIHILNMKYCVTQETFNHNISYKNSLICSVMTKNIFFAAKHLKDIYTKYMKSTNKIKMIFFSKRSNKFDNPSNKPTFLLKLFLEQNEFLLLQNIYINILSNYPLRNQIVNKDKNENTDKKSNWVDITNFILNYKLNK
jgi:hypothetical protein